jgi:RNA polymerase sigma-70 factor (ECF subfamily)
MSDSRAASELPSSDDVQIVAAEVVARYAQRLYSVAPQHLSGRLAARVDGEDVVQSVFRTFFRRQAAGEFDCETSSDLWRLLVRITICKARAKARRHTGPMRDVRREERPDDMAWLSEAASREPGPEEAAALLDQVESLLEGLPPFYAQLLAMRLEGCKVNRIAAELGVSRQTVYRALKLLQSRLLRAEQDDAGVAGAKKM